jgi:hypothetical protein
MKATVVILLFLSSMLIVQPVPATYEPPYVPPTPWSDQDSPWGTWGFPREDPVVFTLGTTPEDINRYELLAALRSAMDTICFHASIAPGSFEIVDGDPEGGSWVGDDGVNWIYWDDFYGDAAAEITNWNGDPHGWWRTTTCDCRFSTAPRWNIHWRLCSGETIDASDIDIPSVWMHEFMHSLGFLESDPQDCRFSIMYEHAPVRCDQYEGPRLWDIFSLDRLHLNMAFDTGEDANSYDNAHQYVGELSISENQSYNGFGITNSYLTILDHDFYEFRVDYDEQDPYPVVLRAWCSVDGNRDSVIRLQLCPESGPEPCGTGYAEYDSPGEVATGVEGASGRMWSIHVHDYYHWGTEMGPYLLYLELEHMSQGTEELAAARDPKIFQVFDVAGRLIHQAVAPDFPSYRSSLGLRQAVSSQPNGIVFWRARSLGTSGFSSGRFVHLKGGSR